MNKFLKVLVGVAAGAVILFVALYILGGIFEYQNIVEQRKQSIRESIIHICISSKEFDKCVHDNEKAAGIAD